jgi:hypothetical protein
MIDSAKETAGAVTDSVQRQAGPVVAQAQEKLGDLADQASHQATTRLDAQRERAAEGLGSVAQALRQTGQQLREKEQAPFGQYAETAADQVERLSGYLRTHDVSQIVDEAESLARRQPTMFMAGAFGLGLLLARFLKSSGQRMETSIDQASRSYPSMRTGTSMHTGAAARTGPTAITTPSGRHAPSTYGSPTPGPTSPMAGSGSGSTAGSETQRTTPPSERVGSHPLPDAVRRTGSESTSGTETEGPSTSGQGPTSSGHGTASPSR